MTNCRELRIGDLGSVVTGKTPPTSKPEFYGSETPFLTPSDMNECRKVDKTLRYLSTEGVAKVRSSLIPKGSVSVSCIGSDMGKAVLTCSDTVTNQQINSVVVNPNYDYLFVYYNLSGRKTEIQFLASGAAQPIMNKTDFSNLLIKIPNIHTQRAISSVLGALDDKIENNRRMNETLEEMVRAIFKSWFVDFDPVRAKAEGKQPAHMEAETAALFPCSFGDDRLPVGWAWHKMSDCISLTKGRSYKSAELQESDTALVTLKSFLRGGGYKADGLKAYTGKYKDEQTLVSGDLVIALTDVTQEADVIGKPAIVRSDGTFKTLVASLDVGVLRPIVPSISIPFLYCMMMTNDFQAHIYGHTSGTTVLHLGKEGVPKYKFPMSSNEVIDRFTVIAEPIFSKIELNENNSNTLAKMRDTLLPKLMSGEIRIKEVEKEVEAIA
jgi:type I restriction enzyme, S subunit